MIIGIISIILIALAIRREIQGIKNRSPFFFYFFGITLLVLVLGVNSLEVGKHRAQITQLKSYEKRLVKYEEEKKGAPEIFLSDISDNLSPEAISNFKAMSASSLNLYFIYHPEIKQSEKMKKHILKLYEIEGNMIVIREFKAEILKKISNRKKRWILLIPPIFEGTK